MLIYTLDSKQNGYITILKYVQLTTSPPNIKKVKGSIPFHLVSINALEIAINMSLASWMIKIIVPAAISLHIIENNMSDAATKWCKVN